MYLGIELLKYMGSKRWMLDNGLGEIIDSRISQYDRFVDLFCGSSSVSWYVASTHKTPVLANDLQEFCRILASSVLCRTGCLGTSWITSWINRANDITSIHPLYYRANSIQQNCEDLNIYKLTTEARNICLSAKTPITLAYGGYYFSPLQSIYLDSLRIALPVRNPYKVVALASLIQAASVCAASPGHTAQPFRPTPTAEPHLRKAWSQKVFERVRYFAEKLSKIETKTSGFALKGDANTIAKDLNSSDLVFIDPPYSALHYSRFYHVLETLANGQMVSVSGAGRYPPHEFRPRSSYSLQNSSRNSLEQLLETLGQRNTGIIITFPAGKASNGLSGEKVLKIANEWFSIKHKIIKGRFSTLGGNTQNRSARMQSEELIISLYPKNLPKYRLEC